MELHLDDDGFVRGPAAACYRVLSNVAAWPSWWGGTRVAERPGRDHFRVVIGDWPARSRLDVRAHAWRHERGFRLVVAGDLVGDAEFWLEPDRGGTVVHHLATLTGGARGIQRYRRWVRGGLWGVKDQVQGAVLRAGTR